MDSARWIGVAAAAVVAVFLIIHLRDPHRTALPFGSTDLTPVKAQLDKLPDNERELVEEYVQRSHGDVLPLRFADPDNPLTARTFGEAIALERQWRDKQKVVQAGADARLSDRERELAPLRAVVSATVAKRDPIPASAPTPTARNARCRATSRTSSRRRSRSKTTKKAT